MVNVIHANFGGASAPPPSRPSGRPSPLDLSASEIAEATKANIDALIAERSTMSPKARLDRAEEFVQCAIRHWESGGLLNMQIAGAHILAASVMGARD